MKDYEMSDLRVILIEDDEDEAHQVLRALHDGGYAPLVRRTTTAAAFASALDEGPGDVVIAAWALSHFSALEALRALQQRACDIPLIVVYRTISEETAVTAMLAGATDIIGLDRLTRLAPAVAREMRAAGLRAQLRAAAEHQRLQAQLLAHVNDAVIGTDLQLRIQSWNPAATVLYGWNADEVIGRPLADVHPVTRYLNGQSMEAALDDLRTGGLWTGVVIQLHRDGHELVIDSVVRLVRDDAGTPIGMVAVNRNISARHQAEAALQAGEERFRVLFEHSPDSIVLVDPYDPVIPWKIVDCNLAACRLNGYTRDELVGLSTARLDPEDATRLPDEAFLDLVRRSGDLHGIDAHRRKDGSLVPVAYSVALVTIGGRELLLGIDRNISERVQAEDDRRRSEAYFRALTEHTAEVISVLNSDGTLRYSSPAQERLLGFSAAECIGCSGFENLEPSDLPRAQEAFARVLDAPGETLTTELRVRHRDGSWRVIETSATNLLDDPDVGGIVLNSRDITDRKQAEEQLLHQLSFTRTITASLGEGLYTLDRQGRLTFMNPAAERILGWTEAELLGEDMHALIHAQRSSGHLLPKDDCPLLAVLQFGQSVQQDDDVFTRKDGTLLPVAYSSAPLMTAGQITGTVVAFHDISERKQLQAKLAHDALHDPLTGLPNRTLFFDRVGQAIDRVARQRAQQFCLLLLDLDNFKNANESLGHLWGDRLLQEISGRLERCVGPGDSLARLGGDEFAILLEDLPSIHDATAFAERVLDALAEPVVLDAHKLVVRASIGLMLGDATYTAEGLLRDADIAMYRAKRLGRARVEVFAPGMLDEALARLRIEGELRDAIGQNQLVLHYQPIVASTSGQIVGVEALIRWQHPRMGLIGPGAFVPVAEETGLIVPMGAWVLREACAQAVAWQRAGLPPIFVSVNVAAKQLCEPDFARQVAAILQESGLDPRWLELEVTETSAMADVALSTRVLMEARALGLRGIAIDDFGTGYSSLSMLQELPITHVKIDRSFIRNLEMERKNVTLARTIIAMSHALDCKVIAEGVETEGQHAILRDIGCDKAQGYLFSRPVPADQLETLLTADIVTA